LDVGCGYPASPNVHDVVPGARVIYADNDQLALIHARAVHAGNPDVGVTFADARKPHELLTHPLLRRLFDPSEPVAVLMVQLLEFLPDAAAAMLVQACTTTFAAGSCVVLTHTTTDVLPPAAGADLRAAASAYSKFVAPFRLRDFGEINAVLGDCRLRPPGVARLSDAPVVGAVASH
jgi:hypothetical protein